MAHDNQLVIGGTATFDDLGLILLDDVSLAPPEINSYTVDVPGGSPVDLTEYSGDVTFSKREQSFQFLLTSRDPHAIEVEKTNISKLFHGLMADYTLSWDPGYTYHGRFSVDEYPNDYSHGTITLKVTAEPYKRGATQTWKVNAAGGVTITLPCGRKRVCPTIEVAHEALVTFEGQSWTLEPGASKINDLWIKPGDNQLTINTYPDYSISAWTDLGDITWAEITDYTYWYEAAAGSQPLQTSLLWSDLGDVTWASTGTKRWIEEMHDAEASPEYVAYINYDVLEI